MLVSATPADDNDKTFGGFSGLLMLSETTALALSDRSTLWRFDFQRDAQDNIAEISAGPVAKIRPGKSQTHRSLGRDAEGLALMSSGQLAIAFERRTRVALYPMPQSDGEGVASLTPRQLLMHPGWPRFKKNKTFEAVAADGQGALYAIPEGVRVEGQIPVYQWRDGIWRSVGQVPPSGRFVPVGADFGPDGRLYVLERSFHVIGFRTQLRSFAMGADGLSDMRLHLRTALGAHDNLEGLGVWRDTRGHLRATMIADDNFSFLQQTEIVEYLLPE